MSINNTSMMMKYETKNANLSVFSKTFTRKTQKSTLPGDSKYETPRLGFSSEKGIKNKYCTKNYVVSDFREKFLNTRRVAKPIKRETGFKFSSNIKLIASNSFASTRSKESENTIKTNNYNSSIFSKQPLRDKKENIKIIQSKINENLEIQNHQPTIKHCSEPDIFEISKMKLKDIQNDFLKTIKEKSAIKKELKKKVIQAFKRETILKYDGFFNKDEVRYF